MEKIRVRFSCWQIGQGRMSPLLSSLCEILIGLGGCMSQRALDVRYDDCACLAPAGQQIEPSLQAVVSRVHGSTGLVHDRYPVAVVPYHHVVPALGLARSMRHSRINAAG